VRGLRRTFRTGFGVTFRIAAPRAPQRAQRARRTTSISLGIRVPAATTIPVWPKMRQVSFRTASGTDGRQSSSVLPLGPEAHRARVALDLVVASEAGASGQPPNRTPVAAMSVAHSSTASGTARPSSSEGPTPFSTQMKSAYFTSLPLSSTVDLPKSVSPCRDTGRGGHPASSWDYAKSPCRAVASSSPSGQPC
jgi:hypothetical protein